MRRSEMKEHEELKDSISSSLMMMWSVALTGSKQLKVPSVEAIKACQDLRPLRGSSERNGIASYTQPFSSQKKNQEEFQHGVNGVSKLPKNHANTTAQSIILKLATWLLKRKRSGK